jgi:hypothetical protein
MTATQLAKQACLQTAGLLGVDPATEACMLEAARECPEQAYDCYRAILISHNILPPLRPRRMGAPITPPRLVRAARSARK